MYIYINLFQLLRYYEISPLKYVGIIYIYSYSYLFISFYLYQCLISLKPKDNLPINGHTKIRILQSVEWWQTMHDLRMKLNPESSRQKQHYTRRLLVQKLGVIFKDETSFVLHLVYSFVWCGKLDSSESGSELLGTFWNVVLQKVSSYQLDWLFEKWKSISKNRGEQNYRTHNETKEA